MERILTTTAMIWVETPTARLADTLAAIPLPSSMLN
jgi:hypothetical protein